MNRPIRDGREDPNMSYPEVPGPPVLISVVVANFNGAAFIEAAIRSALAQSLHAIEIIVADDASTDDSAARVAALAAADKRVRLLRAPANGGPGAARNRCLAAARGEWIAVLDSDDLMHPHRLARLVAAAGRDGADIAADDLMIFHESAAVPPETCLRGRAATAPFWVDAADYVAANLLFGGAQSLGYLKPLIRTALIRAQGLRYDTTLRIAEDYDLILRALLGGARFRVYPDLTYFYRKHSQSISHRLSARALEPMLQAHDRLRSAIGVCEPRLDAAMARRRATIDQALQFDRLVETLKRRDWRGALCQAVLRPRVAALLRGPLIDRLRRPRQAPPGIAPGRRQVCVISRQRVVGHTNGSSVYLLSLCAAMRDSGCDVHLLCPSPVVFGRWPAMKLQPEMQIFSSIRVRGSLRIGAFLVATNPRIAVRAAAGVLGRVLSRLGVAVAGLNRPAPYAVGVPWAREDFLFVARHGRHLADVVIADYAFLTEGIPYALRPGAKTAVIMHDLFSSRAGQFDRFRAADSVAAIDEAAEMALLGGADAIIAIQAEEAAIVERLVPYRQVITAPMAITPVAAPQPGSGHTVLFVGSNTAPNVFGLRWFIEAVWQTVRQAVPDATLLVAGTVGNTVTAAGAGVQVLGRVADLAAVYANAAVVVSPLQVGSGLKIKLIEALGHGKAIVATDVTLQGVDAAVRDAIAVADAPDAFAAEIIDLLGDMQRRARLARAALDMSRSLFSAEICYGGVLRFIESSNKAIPSLDCV